eukprot:3945626-Prymnesium_polylepis.1
MAATGGRWAGVRGLNFGSSGVLSTPWGTGKWGVVPMREAVLFADFGGARHELTFEHWPKFVSTRCSDGEIVRGELAPGVVPGVEALEETRRGSA